MSVGDLTLADIIQYIVVIVLGAAGGTGIAAIQVGKFLGLRVIASASSEDKRHAALAAGADLAVDPRRIGQEQHRIAARLERDSLVL